MKLSFIHIFLFLFFLAGCGRQEKEIKGYGFPKDEGLQVSFSFSELKNYGKLLDRIEEITCNDNIPKIVVEDKYIIRNIYPIANCEPILFHPKEKNMVTFEKGKFYQNHFATEIKPDSLGYILKNNFAYYLSSNKSGKPDSYVIIIESKRNENLDGIENFLIDLTAQFDKLNSDLNLNIAFWEVVPYILPPPTYPEHKNMN